MPEKLKKNASFNTLKQKKMKLLRNSLAAIFAILAISATIAAHAGAFEKAKVFPTGDCLISDPLYRSSGTYFLGTGCLSGTAQVTCDDDQIGQFINSSVQNTTFVECDGLTDDLCCIVLSSSTANCNGQKRQIVDIYCGERP